MNQAEKQSDKEKDSLEEYSLVFFDGVCGLCNNTVDFLLAKDQNDALKFAPLQGETANQVLEPEHLNLNSIVLLDHGRVWKKSAAIVRILWKLPQPWKSVGAVLWIIPQPLRDIGYSIVAKLRYKLFGKHETCRMPTEKDRSKLLN